MTTTTTATTTTTSWLLLLLLLLGVHCCLAAPRLATALSRWQHELQEAQKLPFWEAGSSLAKRGEQAQPLSVDDILRMAGTKRKVFWQPLGYLPASARIASQQASQAANAQQSSEAGQAGTSLLRYG